MTLVVDAAPLITLGDAADPLHTAVAPTLHSEVGDLVVPAPVSAEIDYMLRGRVGAKAARLFLADVAAGRFRVEGLSAAEHDVVAELDEKYAALDLGLADLSAVVLAKRFRTRRLLTLDERDFRAVTPIDGGWVHAAAARRRHRTASGAAAHPLNSGSRD